MGRDVDIPPLAAIGGVEKTDENSQFQFGNCENPGGGLDFSKMSELE